MQECVIEFRDHCDDARPFAGIGHLDVQAEMLHRGSERLLDHLRRQLLRPEECEAQEKAVVRPVPMLVGLEDIAVKLGDGRADAGNNSR